MSRVHHGSEETLHLHPPHCEAGLCHPASSPPTIEIPDRRKFYMALGLTGLVMLLEIVGGLITNSLALLSDAGHMLTHLLALSVSFLASLFSRRPPTLKKSFGFYRLEILAALFNGFFLFLVTFWILVEAYRRFEHPEPIATKEMFIIALIGLATNLLCAFFLSGTKREDLNMRSAILHLAGDTLASVGVVLGAIVLAYTGWWWIDPVLGLLISILILIWAFRLVREAVDVLLEATPGGIDPERVADAVKVFKEVQDVHDIHVWTLSSGIYALSAHVSVRNMSLRQCAPLLKKIHALLCERFKIGHAAIQLETEESLSAPFEFSKVSPHGS